MPSKQLSSLELHFVLKELKELEGSRIDKIRQPEKNTLIIVFYKSNAGKSTLHISVGKSIFLAQEKESGHETLGFGMFLRRHIDGRFLESIEQIKPERIIRLTFGSKKEKLHLFLEFFGGGNAILCSEDGMIMDSLQKHEFKDRTISPKTKYKNPKTKYNLYGLELDDLFDLLKNSGKNNIVTCLAVELGLGGTYAEEICLQEGIGKEKGPKTLGASEISSIFSSIKKLLSRKIQAQAVLENQAPIDAVPFPLKYYENLISRNFESFSQSLEFLHINQKQASESEIDKRIRGLNRIIGEQQLAIEILKQEEIDLRSKGEIIYHKYALVKGTMEQITKASSKLSWNQIKEKLASHAFIKKIDERFKIIEIEL